MGEEILGDNIVGDSSPYLWDLLLCEGVGSITGDVLGKLQEESTAVVPVSLGGNVRELVIQVEGGAEAEGERFLEVLQDILDNKISVASRQAVKVPHCPVSQADNDQGPVLFII